MKSGARVLLGLSRLGEVCESGACEPGSLSKSPLRIASVCLPSPVPQQPAEARSARPDRAADRRWSRDGRDHARRRRDRNRRMALAGAVHAEGRGRAVARQDAPVAHPAFGVRDHRAGGRAHARAAPRRDDALDRLGDGQRDRHQRQFGAAHLACPRPAAASAAPVQAVQRSQPQTLRVSASSPPSCATSNREVRRAPSASTSTRRRMRSSCR